MSDYYGLTPPPCAVWTPATPSALGGVVLEPRVRSPSRFTSFGAEDWSFGEGCDAVGVSSSRDVAITGVVLHSALSVGEYHGWLAIYHGDREVSWQDVDYLVCPADLATTRGGSNFYVVVLDAPVVFRQGVVYDVVLYLQGPGTGRSGRGGQKATTAGDGCCGMVVFSFSESARDENGTCIEHGQIPALEFAVLPPGFKDLGDSRMQNTATPDRSQLQAHTFSI